MKSATALLALATVLLPGCGNLKPVVHEVRHFVLTPGISNAAPSAAFQSSLGVAPVVLPPYLLDQRIAIHRSDNEIYYAPNSRWAERLDKNIQRVIAANLQTLLGTTNIHLSSWRSGEVAAELELTFSRLNLDDKGNILLQAQWTIINHRPASRRSGVSKLTRPNPGGPLKHDEAVAALSAALAELSQEIAADLK